MYPREAAAGSGGQATRREGEVESAVSCAPLYGLRVSVDEGGGDGADVVGLEGLGGEARGAVASAVACPRLADNTVQVADELERLRPAREIAPVDSVTKRDTLQPRAMAAV